MTPGQIRRLLAGAEARAEKLRIKHTSQMNAVLTEIELYRQLLEQHRVDLSLQSEPGPARIIDTMEMNTAVRGAKLGTKHVGAMRIRKVDGSVARFAAKHGLFATTVRSWYAAGEAARRIPRKWVNDLKAKPYLIPESAWKNGIEE